MITEKVRWKEGGRKEGAKYIKPKIVTNKYCYGITIPSE